MSATLEIESTSEGSIAVPARLLLETLKTFPEQPLTFTVKENSTIEISSDLGKYVLAYLQGDEFPKAEQLEDPSKTEITAEISVLDGSSNCSDRKSTRLNSSHVRISYAVFCLK